MKQNVSGIGNETVTHWQERMCIAEHYPIACGTLRVHPELAALDGSSNSPGPTVSLERNVNFSVNGRSKKRRRTEQDLALWSANRRLHSDGDLNRRHGYECLGFHALRTNSRRLPSKSATLAA